MEIIVTCVRFRVHKSKEFLGRLRFYISQKIKQYWNSEFLILIGALVDEAFSSRFKMTFLGKQVTSDVTSFGVLLKKNGHRGGKSKKRILIT